MSGPVGVLLDLLFPPKCVFCGRLLTSGERDFCARCQRELPWLEGPEAEQTGEFSPCAPLRWPTGTRYGIPSGATNSKGGRATTRPTAA